MLTRVKTNIYAYFSGIEGPTSTPFQFNDDDIDDVLLPIRTQSGFLGVDILLTASWPKDVAQVRLKKSANENTIVAALQHSLNQPTVQTPGSSAISRLAAGLKPRYHLAGQGAHFERSPYRFARIRLLQLVKLLQV